MQQEKNVQKQQELNILDELIKNGCTESDPSSAQLRVLCFKYPYQYIQLMKKNGRLDTPPDASLLVKAYIFAFRLTNEHYWNLQRYLVQQPAGEKQQKEFDLAVEVFEDMILRQTKEN